MYAAGGLEEQQSISRGWGGVGQAFSLGSSHEYCTPRPLLARTLLASVPNRAENACTALSLQSAKLRGDNPANISYPLGLRGGGTKFAV